MVAVQKRGRRCIFNFMRATRMKNKIITVIVILIGIIVLLFINRFKIFFYLNQYGEKVQNAFNAKYGVDTKIVSVSNDGNSNIWGGNVRLETVDGAIVDCEYDLFGNMISDSYSNIVYAYEDIKRVNQHVNKYFDEFNVVESFDISHEIDGFYYDNYKIKETCSATYEEYLVATKEHQRYLLVQLSEEEDLSELEDLLQDLENEFSEQNNFTVLIKNYPEGLYKAYEGRSIIANYMSKNYGFNYDALGVGVKADVGPCYTNNVVAVYNFNGETKIMDKI